MSTPRHGGPGGSGGMLSLDELRAEAEAGTIDTVVTAFTDMQGRLEGKRIEISYFLDEVVSHGVEGCNYLLALDMEMDPVPGYEMANWEKGYGDFGIAPDMATLRRIPWLDRTALVLCDVVDHDGSPVAASPRQVLIAQYERAQALGYTVLCASELEFYLYKESYAQAHEQDYRGLTPTIPYILDYHILATTMDEEYVGAIRRGMQGAGIPVEFSKGEAWYGQHELNWRYADAVTSADRHVIYKNGVKEIAFLKGISATFMAKPSEKDIGSSCHVHSSLIDAETGASVFVDEQGQETDVFRHYLGGQRARLRELALFVAPTINSYKRYAAESWAPTSISWGRDNRTCGFRVVGHGQSRRAECRIPGADVNPYLGYAALLAAGLDGIENKTDPGPELKGNAYEAGKAEAFPSTLREAVDLWEGSEFARATFGEHVWRHYLNYGRTEQRLFDEVVTDYERRRMFERGMMLAVVEPATEQVMTEVPRAGVEEVDEAVARAKAAFPAWRALAPGERAERLRALADALEKHREYLAQVEARNAGKPISDARGEMGMVVDVFRYYAGAPERLLGDSIPVAGGQAFTVREPLGVVGLIVPWNFPLTIAAWKLGPALAAGNTVVLKPAELTPLTAMRFESIAVAAGLPEGVVNVVVGPGRTCGQRLVEHPDVAKIAFTGSTEVGRSIAAGAAQTIKRVTLELGGKSPNVVFADADLEAAAAAAPMAVFGNAGQDCCARSRILVQRAALDTFMGLLEPAVKAIVVGDPLDERTEMGPLISAGQRETVGSFLDGDAPVAIRGSAPDGAGYWFAPTVLCPVEPDARAAREEIFGPIATVIPFEDEEDAVRLANDTIYGLSGSIWTRDGARALRVARAIDTGVLAINSNTSVRVTTPFGGFKQSGYGRELGPHALDAYTEVKSIFYATS